MKIFVYNDGKEKIQSYEAYVASPILELRAYGASKKEALNNLEEQITEMRQELLYLNSDDAIEVNYSGEEIE